MTREEMDFIGGMNMCDEISNEAYKKIMCHCEEQEPKTGHWIKMRAYEKWECSACNTVFRFTFREHDYCPNCGARMVEPQEKYCDRNICMSNEYNGIGCDECEVTKSHGK